MSNDFATVKITTHYNQDGSIRTVTYDWQGERTAPLLVSYEYVYEVGVGSIPWPLELVAEGTQYNTYRRMDV